MKIIISEYRNILFQQVGSNVLPFDFPKSRSNKRGADGFIFKYFLNDIRKKWGTGEYRNFI